jgi:hypothetical protein
VKLTKVMPPAEGRHGKIGRLGFVAAKREGLIDGLPEVEYRRRDVIAAQPRKWKRAAR